MSEMHNPFVLFGYAGEDYFCDREMETQELISALQNGRNITLRSPRRIGKTGLIHHVFKNLKNITYSNQKKWNRPISDYLIVLYITQKAKSQEPKAKT